MAKRIDFVDNVKGLLIFLVVYGHFLLPIHGDSVTCDVIYKAIYFFHMPLFIFISGYLAKRAFCDGQLRVEKILSFLLLAMLFQAVLLVLEKGITAIPSELLKFGGAPWYLVSLAFWYLLTPLFVRLKPLPTISCSLVLALFAGMYPDLGHTLALSRTIVFLPYFLMGFYMQTEFLLRVKRSKYLLIPCFLTLGIIVALIMPDETMLDRVLPMVYGTRSYRDPVIVDAFLRLMTYPIAISMSLCVIYLTPEKKSRMLAYLGKHTLQIYIVHRICRSILAMLGLHDLAILANGLIAPFAILAISIAVTAFSLIPVFGKPLDGILRLKWSIFVK